MHGIATVGLLESTTELLAGPLARAVAEHLPHVELRLLSAYSGHLQQWLDTGEADLSLTYKVTASGSVAVVPLLHESLWAVAPADAGLDPATPLPWAELWTNSVVLPVRGHGLRVLVDEAVTATAPPRASRSRRTRCRCRRSSYTPAGVGRCCPPRASSATWRPGGSAARP